MKDTPLYGTQCRIFQCPILELTTLAPPYVVLPFYGLLIAFFLFLNVHFHVVPWGLLACSLFVAGTFCFSLVEYILHRFVFHAFEKHPRFAKLHFLIHGVHHDFTKDKMRLMMPPALFIILAGVLYVFFYLLLGVYSFVFFAGFLLGAALYDSIHYSIHHLMAPKFLRKLWAHHLIHHTHAENNFGVSSSLWDHLFQTKWKHKEP